MEGSDGLVEALAVDLASASLPPERWLVAASVDADALRGFATSPIPDRELARHIRDAPRGVACVFGKIPAAAARALAGVEPGLVVLTAGADPKWVAALKSDGVAVLGPHARLCRGDGELILCASEAHELGWLERATGESLRLGVAPTPAWFPRLVLAAPYVDAPAVGTVQAAALDHSWTALARDKHRAATVIVPLGLPTPATDDALAEELVACGAGHALERLTGPLFPSPRVLLQTAAGLGGTSKATAGSGEALNTALWSQARRALPELGGLEAMEAPDPGLAMGVPTAAFLAQAAILRARGARKALSRRAPALPSVDGAGVERAHQLLLKAGTQLSDQEAKVVLRGYGMPVTRQAVATSASGAAHFADRIGYPVLLKVASPDLRRGRDEDRRWRLEQIETAAATRRAYTQIIETLEQDAPTVRVDGVVVSEHVGAGMDVHCGALRCADGSLVLYAVPPGPGRRRPPLWCPLPLGRAEAHRFAHNVLTTAAAQRALDARSSALATVFLHLERLVDDTGPRLLHVDLGPVRLGDMDEGFVVVDARMTQRPHLEGA